MLLKFPSRKQADSTPAEALTHAVSIADFLPYTFHYDPRTLLTKNGETLQILRITRGSGGLDYEADGEAISLRDALLAAIRAQIPSDRYALWIHTLRRRHPIRHAGEAQEDFTNSLSAAWRRKYRFDYRYTNEIYLSVLRQGEKAELFSPKTLARGILPARHRLAQEARIKREAEELSGVVDALMAELSSSCDATPLGVVHRGEGYVSEPLSFLHSLITLADADVPLQPVDASRQLASGDLLFGYDTLESRPEPGRRRFAAVLTLKPTRKLPHELLAQALEVPEELIISQAVTFLPARQALEPFSPLRAALAVSEDSSIAALSGLTDSLSGDTGAPTDFVEQQTTVTLIHDQYEALDTATGKLQDAFAALGLVAVREDVGMEEGFWAQLPGNFAFLNRRRPESAIRIATTARLNRFPSGEAEEPEGKSSPPIAILPTLQNTPYAFRLRDRSGGHAALLDFNSFADERGAALLNFLLAQNRKEGGRLFVFDRRHVSEALVRALGGVYTRPHDTHTMLNPFLLEDTPRARAFLSAWLAECARACLPRDGMVDGESLRATTREAVEALFASDLASRHLKAAFSLLERSVPGFSPAAAQSLLQCFGESDTLDFSSPVWGIAMDEAVERPELTVPVFAYLLHRIILSLDGTPTLIVLNEAWELLDNEFFAARIGSLLAMLSQNNAQVLFTTRRLEAYEEHPLSAEILSRTGTVLFLPDDVPVDYLPELTQLTPPQSRALLRMERQKGEFLVRHGAETVACRFTAEDLPEFRDILNGDARALRRLQIREAR